MFFDSGACFGFCDVFSDSVDVFWILGSVLGIWDVFCPCEPL